MLSKLKHSLSSHPSSNDELKTRSFLVFSLTRKNYPREAQTYWDKMSGTK